MRNVILLFFSTIMITDLGFGLEDTGLGLEHAVLEPIPRRVRYSVAVSSILMRCRSIGIDYSIDISSI